MFNKICGDDKDNGCGSSYDCPVETVATSGRLFGYVSLVFWNQDEPTTKAAISFYITDKELSPEELINGTGFSLAQFCEMRSISVETFQKNFPGYIEIGWHGPIKQCLPMDKSSIEKLAHLANISISVFAFYKSKGDKVPQLLFKV